MKGLAVLALILLPMTTPNALTQTRTKADSIRAIIECIENQACENTRPRDYGTHGSPTSNVFNSVEFLQGRSRYTVFTNMKHAGVPHPDSTEGESPGPPTVEKRSILMIWIQQGPSQSGRTILADFNTDGVVDMAQLLRNKEDMNPKPGAYRAKEFSPLNKAQGPENYELWQTRYDQTLALLIKTLL